MVKLNFFNKKEERDKQPFSYGGMSVASYFGNYNNVTEEKALSIPAVSAAVELITSSIAQLPITLNQKKNSNEVIKVPNDRRVHLLNKEPNESQNGYNFKKSIIKDYLLYGSNYIKVDRIRNDVTALYSLPVLEVLITKYKNGYKETAMIQLNTSGDSTEYVFTPDEMVITLKNSRDGFTSNGVLEEGKEILNLALNEQKYSNGILQNGALPVGVLKAGTRLTEKAIKNIRESWQNLYSGAGKNGKTIILEEGLDYQPLSLKPDEMDLTNSKKSTISEIARLFNIPESMINSSANKYASNEQNNIYFLQYCISPILSAVEAAINKSLLLETEKSNGYYFRFDTSELIRSTEKEKIEAASNGLKDGIFSFNEARQRLGLPNNEEDFFMWNLGSIFYNPETKEMILPNTNTKIQTNEKPGVNPPEENSEYSEKEKESSVDPPENDDPADETEK